LLLDRARHPALPLRRCAITVQDWANPQSGVKDDDGSDPEYEHKEKEGDSQRKQRLVKVLRERSDSDPDLLEALALSLSTSITTPQRPGAPTVPPIRATPAPRVWREPACLSTHDAVIAIAAYALHRLRALEFDVRSDRVVHRHPEFRRPRISPRSTGSPRRSPPGAATRRTTFTTATWTRARPRLCSRSRS